MINNQLHINKFIVTTRIKAMIIVLTRVGNIYML